MALSTRRVFCCKAPCNGASQEPSVSCIREGLPIAPHSDKCPSMIIRHYIEASPTIYAQISSGGFLLVIIVSSQRFSLGCCNELSIQEACYQRASYNPVMADDCLLTSEPHTCRVWHQEVVLPPLTSSGSAEHIILRWDAIME